MEQIITPHDHAILQIRSGDGTQEEEQRLRARLDNVTKLWLSHFEHILDALAHGGDKVRLQLGGVGQMAGITIGQQLHDLGGHLARLVRTTLDNRIEIGEIGNDGQHRVGRLATERAIEIGQFRFWREGRQARENESDSNWRKFRMKETYAADYSTSWTMSLTSCTTRNSPCA